MKAVRWIRSGLFFACLIVGAVFVLFPFFWMLSTSLKVEGKGMTFDFLPKRDVVVGPFEMSADGMATGPSRDDRSALGTDSTVRFAFHDSFAHSITASITDESGTYHRATLAMDASCVWSAKDLYPAGKYKYSFEIHRDFSGAMHSLYTLDNYRKIALNDSYPFLRYLMNSFVVAFSASLLTVFICALAAYVFAKKNFAGKTTLFWTFMAAMMIPGMMYMVPQFAIVTSLGWINTLQGLVIPHLANVFGLFMLKQFMEAIPDSLFEAARIDGAGEWTVFRRIVFPLSLPSLSILFLLTFVGQWNNFLWQLLVNTPDSPLITLPVGLALFRGQYETRWEQMMAASSFSIIPIVILFLFTQKFLIEGLTAGGVKE